MQQQWQWQHYNITVHTSVTADSAVMSSDVQIGVTVMSTSLWK